MQKVLLKNSKWNDDINNENVNDFIDVHDVNTWYQTRFEEACIILEDEEGDLFVVKITDELHEHFEIISTLKYLSLSQRILTVISEEVASVCG